MKILLFSRSAITSLLILDAQCQKAPVYCSFSQSPQTFEARMRLSPTFACVLLFTFITCTFIYPTGQAVAQVDRAGLNGTITDPSGKVVPGVHVIAEMPA